MSKAGPLCNDTLVVQEVEDWTGSRRGRPAGLGLQGGIDPYADITKSDPRLPSL